MSIARVFLLLAILVGLAYGQRCGAEISESNTDLWDVSQGSVVTATSGSLDWGGFFVSDIRGMFGFENSGKVEPASTIFGDQIKGFVHWVEWETLSPITLRSFMLSAGHDGQGRDANARGFSRFSLFAESSNTGLFDTVLFELFPANPYGDTLAPGNAIIETSAQSFMFLANVRPTQASRFRAEFVQYGDNISSALGPRIGELDGFNTFFVSVPEPSSMVLAVLGLVVVLGRHNPLSQLVPMV